MQKNNQPNKKKGNLEDWKIAASRKQEPEVKRGVAEDY